MSTTKHQLMLKAFKCLRLEAPEEVCADVERIVLDRIAEIEAQHALTLPAIPLDGGEADAIALEERIRLKLAEVAPPGTPNTPELRAKVRGIVLEMVTAEFDSAGIAGPQKDLLLAALMASLGLRHESEAGK